MVYADRMTAELFIPMVYLGRASVGLPFRTEGMTSTELTDGGGLTWDASLPEHACEHVCVTLLGSMGCVSWLGRLLMMLWSDGSERVERGEPSHAPTAHVPTPADASYSTEGGSWGETRVQGGVLAAGGRASRG